jgi:hypothetical protein
MQRTARRHPGKALQATRLLPLLLATSPLALALISTKPSHPAPRAQHRTPASDHQTPEQPSTQKLKAPNPRRQAQDPLKASIQPFLAKFCTPCHSGSGAPAGLQLGNLKTEKDLLGRRYDFDKVAERVVKKSMPPAGAAQPSKKQRDAFIAALQTVFAKAPPSPVDPGRPTLRRLNRAEYDNTVRDLFGIDFHPSDDFPSDDVGYGFDNIGDVLSVSPLLLEKYLDAAEKIADLVLPPNKLKTLSFDAGSLKTDTGNEAEGVLLLYTNGYGLASAEIAETGTYAVRVKAFGKQAGPDPCKMELKVDGKVQAVFEVRAVEPQPYAIPPIELSQGRHRIAAAFINDFYNPNDPNPANRDRNMMIVSIEVTGPMNKAQPDSPARRRFMIASPDPQDPLPGCRTVLSTFLRRAFRRPVSSDEIEKYIGFVQAAVKEKRPIEQGMKLAIQAALVSPHFLFRVELDPGDGQAGGPKARPATRGLNNHELASRLSYFLWSSMPDDALMALADTGRLREPQVLQAEVSRMIKDAKARALTENFAGQWLNLRKLDQCSPDPGLFPSWSEQLRKDMRAETEAFFEGIVRGDRSVIEFLNADYTFVNERLARYYGLTNVAGPTFQRVQLTDRKRSGIITQAALLTLTSNPNRTSPVKRGKWVLENLLGEPPPPPPPGIAPLPGDTDKIPTMTIKERLRLHRQKPECGVCHVKMDALGFALENFDPVGRWRTKDGPFAIDSSERMGDGTLIAGPEGLTAYLMKRKDDFVRTLADRMLTYALGRGTEPSDRPTLDKIAKQTAKSGYRFSGLIKAAVQSEAFLRRRVN